MCIRCNNGLSDSFSCPIGLRQGCNLSPTLFSLFINDLYTYIEHSGAHGVQLTPSIVEVFRLMFADDVALISDTVVGLQRQLNSLKQFCNENKLIVNTTKTKDSCFWKRGSNSP